MLIDRLFSNKLLLRDIEAEELLESFLVSAIAAVLGVRMFLNLANYPMLGGEVTLANLILGLVVMVVCLAILFIALGSYYKEIALVAGGVMAIILVITLLGSIASGLSEKGSEGGLQIAHVLWGGLLMMLAILIRLVLLSKYSAKIAAVLGGGGFGLFIDEIGKFITHDNNYFFQPSIAIIYLVFVLIYLFSQNINKRKMSQREYLINSIHIAHEAVYNDLDGFEKEKALHLLNECDKRDPMVKAVRAFIRRLEQVKPKKPGVISRLENLARTYYHTLVAKKWFSGAIITFFVVQAITSLWHATAVVKGIRLLIAALLVAIFSALKLIGSNAVKKRIAYALLSITALAAMWNAAASLQNPQLSVINWGELVSSIISGALVVSGLWQIRKSRINAYNMFKMAVLVSIFLTQFFAFYKEQLSALVGLAWNITILLTLRYMINEELKMHKNGQLFLRKE